MRFAIMTVLALAGCGPGVQTSVDAAAGAPDALVADALVQDPREAVAATTDSGDVIWALRARACPLESGPGCPPPGPSLCRSGLDGGDVSLELESRGGARALAVDGSGAFVLLAADNETTFFELVRVDPTGTVPLAGESISSSALALDPTHVYWARQGVNGERGAIMRALKSGDGTDRVDLFVRPFGASQILVEDDWIYWLEPGASARLWKAEVGGLPEPLGDDTLGETMTVRDGVVYTWRPGGSHADLVAIELDGSIRVVAEDATIGAPLV